MRSCRLLTLGAAAVSALATNQSFLTRRQAIAAACGSITVAAVMVDDPDVQRPFGVGAQPTNAFDNKISSQYDSRPKQRGSKPAGLGVLKREKSFFDDDDDDDSTSYLGLKPCQAPPNCFCSTTFAKEDPDHSIPAFVWPQGMDQATAMNQLKQVLEVYQPTTKVDGGGFAFQTVTPDYIYVQYESLKNGYVDDVEFAVIRSDDTQRYGDRQVQVRSSSRLGYLDYGVNAKRINTIAAALRAKSWNAVGVDYSTHAFYASENGLLR